MNKGVDGPCSESGSAKNAGEDARAPRGRHKRGYLPHFDVGHSYQMVTYRLADSLPKDVAVRLASELEATSGEALYRKRIEAYLDAGHGRCILHRPEIARIVRDAWKHFDGIRYDLHAWVIMPNHVHVLIAMRDTSLSDIVHAWKSFTAHTINATLGTNGKVWQEDYWDRYIRDKSHYAAAVDYILKNPGSHAAFPAWWIGGKQGRLECC